MRRGKRRRSSAAGVVALLCLALAAARCAVLASLAGPAHAGSGAGLRFRTEVVKDPMSNGIEAFRMLVPNGWVRRGGVVWNLHYSNVASVAMTVTDARSHRGAAGVPADPAGLGPDRYVGPVGTNYLGMEVRQPVSAAALIEQLIVPAFRGSLRPALVRRDALPKVARALTAKGKGTVTSSSYDAARVRIAYTQSGRAMEEDFYADRLLHDLTGAAGDDDVAAGDPLLLQGAAREARRLRARSADDDLLGTDEPEVVRRLPRTSSTSGSRARCRRSTPPGSSASRSQRANDAISRSTSEAWEAQQNAYDRVYGEISNQIRGVETYQNPFEGRTVELPNDYRYAWVSSSGEYALSDSAAFNPNVGSTAEWRLLQPPR